MTPSRATRPKAAAIYARFSSELQSERSIDDQIALCRAYAQRQGYAVAGVYEDRARSGASTIGRAGLEQLLAVARAKQVDVVVIESLDRISRDTEDMARLFKRLKFYGVAIDEVHGGVAGALQVGVRGLVGALYLEDLAHKVRRGLAGVVRDGRSAGGRAYGYRAVPGRPGELSIETAEANVVRRIFADYIDGQTPREIAAALNREGVVSPRGRGWNASTLTGSKQRGHGILRNEIYVGRLIWNRVAMIKDPDTGKRISRVNAPAERHVVDVPHLALLDRAIWDAAAARLELRTVSQPHWQRRPKRLLSGLLRCGLCGGSMASHDVDRHGHPRIRCTRRRETGDCNHNRIYRVDAIERHVLDALRDHLSDPRLIAEYVKEYRAERQRLAGQAKADRDGQERRLAQLAGEIQRGVDSLVQGTLPAAVIGPRVTALEAERKALEAILAAQPPEDVVELHPTATARYLAQIEDLATELQGDAQPAIKAREAMQELIARVTIHPGHERAYEIEISGRQAALIGPAAMPQGRLLARGVNAGSEGGI